MCELQDAHDRGRVVHVLVVRQRLAERVARGRVRAHARARARRVRVAAVVVQPVREVLELRLVQRLARAECLRDEEERRDDVADLFEASALHCCGIRNGRMEKVRTKCGLSTYVCGRVDFLISGSRFTKAPATCTALVSDL